MSSFEDVETLGPYPPDQLELEQVATALRTADPSWTADVVLQFGELAWTPDLFREEPKAVLHIHIAERIRPYAIARMQGARQAGYEVHVAVPLEALYDEELLSDLAALAPIVHVIEGPNTVLPGEPLATTLASVGVQVTPEIRTQLGTELVQQSMEATSPQVRGVLFESAVIFLLSQTEDFEVVAHRFRSANEEFDAVVQQKATHGRVWATIGAPLILVEVKNQQEPVAQREVSVFRTKLAGRRRTVRLGLMFSTSGFTSAALTQELRFASDELTIVFVGPSELLEWIEAREPDDVLERLIREAMLR